MEARAALVGACADGVAVLQDRKYVFTNPAWAQLLEQPESEFDDRSVDQDVHADFRRRLHDWLANSQSAEPSEFSFVRAGGSIAVFHLSPIRTTDGLLGFTARDLTSVKRLQSKQLMVDRMMSVGALAAGVAHEINNPLSYVLGNLTYLLEECGELNAHLPEDRRRDSHEALSEALEGADRVRGIVAGLQSFARADRETLKPVDVNETILTAINMAWIEIRHRARLVKSLAEVPPVHANEATLGQVFLNFLLNASYALPLGRARDNEIKVESYEAGENVVVVITDSGPGIPPEIVNHVFDTFFTKPRPGIGSGLALSISHTIITELGGSITVASGPTGTSFKVVLPALRAEEDEDEEVPEARVTTRAARRVLVIDDEPLLVTSVERALRDHEVHTAGSGQAAVQLLKDDADFDIILCDLLMGDMSGMDVYRWTMDNHPGLHRDIVFMTGDIYGAEVATFLRSVRNHSIKKPFVLNELRRFVIDYVSKAPQTAIER